MAVVGASQRPGKRGYQAVRALLDGGFGGDIYPVNPRGGELLGLPVAMSVEALPTAPDLAYLATPAETIPSILEACGVKGIRGAVVPAVGFRESGDAGAALESRVAEVAARTGIRIVGPNTSGILNTAIGLNLVGVPDMPSGRLAILAQSGNVALDLMTAARGRLGISIYVGIGNETDVAFHECLEYLADHAATDVVIVYVEESRNGRRFLEAARRAASRKPIVLLKGGRSDAGRRAALSHTGAVAGPYDVFRAAMRQVGVFEVSRSDEILAVAEILATQPPVPAGTGVAVLSDGGGHATLAADALSELGVPLARLSEGTRSRLDELLGAAASSRNPIDVAAAADRDPRVLAEAMRALISDPNCGGVLMTGLFGGYSIRFDPQLERAEDDAARALVEEAGAAHRPLVVHSLYARSPSRSLSRLRESGVAVVGSLELAAGLLHALHRRGRDESRITPKPVREADVAGHAAGRAETDAVFGRLLSERRSTLTEPEAREVLGRHGAALVPATFCADEAAVARAAASHESVAVKLVSPALSHKTEAGAVVLNARGADEAADAFRSAIAKAMTFATEREIEAVVEGALVCPMQPPPVVELLIGARRDPRFGPILALGAGGVAVELLGDVAIRVLPVDRELVGEMLAELRLSPLLGGYRGRPIVDQNAVADLALAVADCLLAHPRLAELEVNPAFAYEDRIIAVDVRGVLRDI